MAAACPFVFPPYGDVAALSQNSVRRLRKLNGGGGGARPVGVKMAAPRGLVQYVVLRGDLGRQPLSWPLGALVAQAVHAALAAVHAHRQHPDTEEYLAQGGHMRTVVLEAPDECALSALTETLQQHGIDHKVWVEQPENIATCVALRPYPKENVHHHLKKFKLLK